MRRIVPVILGMISLCGTCVAASSSSSSSSNSLLPYTKLDLNVAYLRVGKFSPETTKKIIPTIKAIADAKPRGLILDLRDNKGGDFGTVEAIMNALLPKGTPYIRHVHVSFRGLEVTSQMPVLKRSTPIIVLRNKNTINEPEIVLYVLNRLRDAGVIEFSDHRSALTRAFKQDNRMSQYFPIKESAFFASADTRVIGDEGGDEDDVVGAAVRLVRERSPWDEAKK